MNKALRVWALIALLSLQACEEEGGTGVGNPAGGSGPLSYIFALHNAPPVASLSPLERVWDWSQPLRNFMGFKIDDAVADPFAVRICVDQFTVHFSKDLSETVEVDRYVLVNPELTRIGQYSLSDKEVFAITLSLAPNCSALGNSPSLSVSNQFGTVVSSEELTKRFCMKDDLVQDHQNRATRGLIWYMMRQFYNLAFSDDADEIFSDEDSVGASSNERCAE